MEGKMTPRVLWVFVVNAVLFTISVYLYTYTPAKVVPLAATPYQYIAQLNRQRFPGDYDGASHAQSSYRQMTDGTQVTPHDSTTRRLDHNDGQQLNGELSGAPNRTSDYYAYRRQTYVVPSIRYTHLVNCAAVLANDSAELRRAREVMAVRPKVPIYEETYDDWLGDCDNFRRHRGYVDIPLTVEEEQFPLAFSIAMYKDVEQAERLLRAIYQPQNIYCFHIDTKTSLLIHRVMRRLVACFPNVFIASHLDKIKWGDVSVLLPAINCMRDFVKYHRGKWKYYINLTGQEFPLRTNLELVRIAKIFNGSNDIAGSMERMDMSRVWYHWTHRWSKTYQQTIFFNTMTPKEGPPFNLTFFKGELHGLFSRHMVEYIIENEVSQRYLGWCWDTGHPSEHYWNVLNYNVHLHAPGGYEGPLDVASEYSFHPIMRAKHWLGMNYPGRQCAGQEVRGICVFAVGDVPWLAGRPELFANKFHLTYEYLGLDCLEERHRNRTRGIEVPALDKAFYRRLPTVLYSRKDGLR